MSEITQEDRDLVHAMVRIMPLAAQMVLNRPSEFYALAARHRIAARERALEECAKVAECAAGEEAGAVAWAMALSVATQIRSLNTPPKLKEA